MAYTRTKKLTSAIYSPDSPTTPRQDIDNAIQEVLDLLDTGKAEKSEIQQMTLGQIVDGSITDTKLSNEPGQIKDKINKHLTDNTKQIPHLGTTTNVGNAYNIASTEIILANQKFTTVFNVASTGAATLNIPSIGSEKGIKRPGGADANIKAGAYSLFYDGINFQLLGEGGEYGTATADEVIVGKTIGTENGIIAGTGINAKRVASGTATTNASGQFTVTGLAFTPRVIISVKQDKSTFIVYYSSYSTTNYYNISPGAASANSIPLDGATYYVNSTGFKLNQGHNNINTQDWIAYE